MSSLDRNLRKDLESAVRKARRAAEAGARQSIEQLAVHHHEPWGPLSPEQRQLRNRLRAHGRQLGDRRDERKGAQAIDRLVGECAYEHWHRLLFARFLAENALLVEPKSGMPVSLDECRELARERSMDWLVLASDFAQRMLPQIFRADDPVLEVTLPPEKRQELEAILEGLPQEVFATDDSLGWVYQFWQAEQKDAVNKSETKIGADELPAVTQLFTEDYMVMFLLHNTLGAWWAGKVLERRPELRRGAASEEELRSACSLLGLRWEYLRFAKAEDGSWRPAAGTFERWPKAAKSITVLDPCMGSGHFLVFVLPILVAFRMAEESLSQQNAIDAVLRENLFGVEIDKRCTQIAAFNLAFAAWRMAGHHALPQMNLACSGLSPSVREQEWLALAGDSMQLRNGMQRLYRMFERAPALGSLIDPKVLEDNLLEAGFESLSALLQKALEREDNESSREVAVTARGLAQAAEILARRFTLVVTNVPYLGRGRQDAFLRDFCERTYPDAKPDLATCFLERVLTLCDSGATTALVTTQNWLSLGGYKKLRERLLRSLEWSAVARLGARAFETITGEIVKVSLVVLTRGEAQDGHAFAAWDAGEVDTPPAKAELLRLDPGLSVRQAAQLQNPDSRVMFGHTDTDVSQLGAFAESYQGAVTGDLQRFVVCFWEVADFGGCWEPFRTAVESTDHDNGLSCAIRWQGGSGELAEYARHSRDQLHDMHESGQRAWGQRAVAINRMKDLHATVFRGEKFDNNVAVLVPKKDEFLLPILSFCVSDEFATQVRALDQTLKVTNQTLRKVPFDIDQWTQVAGERFPGGAPKPSASDPTQWTFGGHPKGSDAALHVAVARLLGFQWPRQIGVPLLDSESIQQDGLAKHGDDDGIVCLLPLKGEHSAADRLRALLAEALAPEWSSELLNQLLGGVGFAGKSLEEWLRDGFFEQHCELFHHRPFVWQVWDGLKNGFSAFVNYHRLAGSDGEARRTLEKLIYTYLGSWIDRQRDDQKAGVEGADGRVASAEHLKRELERILEGEPPYDIFVRWKPLHRQPIGWEPDLNDGVRINIRPFVTARPLNARGRTSCILRVTPKIKWEKDRGKEPSRAKQEFPWFWGVDGQAIDFPGGSEFDGNRWNDLHYSRAIKLAARERTKLGGNS